jgi:formate hydrogenlyase subunit 6/NADH:ubiquinone oxidoreductase subunit I
MKQKAASQTPLLWSLPQFGELLAALARRGYELIAPTVRDGAISYEPVSGVEELPAGYTMEQEAGRCRLRRRSDGALFGYAAGPKSLKNYLHPPAWRALAAERDNGVFRILDQPEPPPRYAFIGVRACELAAARVQDRVLLGDRFQDGEYGARRGAAFIVAVHCTEPAATCFCASMGTGPRATGGYDIALCELAGPDRHVFLVEAGSSLGEEVLAELGGEAAPEETRQAAAQAIEQAASRMQRRIEQEGLRELLYARFEDPHWEDVARRCLCCGNCTMVCPTCFCVTFEDTSDVDGRRAERWRRWDSCFTQSFSYIHGGSVRLSPKSRYRQWLTHKLASWIDQFGTSGCVGCGRCITWCPVGIDITQEVAALRSSARTQRGHNDDQEQESGGDAQGARLRGGISAGAHRPAGGDGA